MRQPPRTVRALSHRTAHRPRVAALLVGLLAVSAGALAEVAVAPPAAAADEADVVATLASMSLEQQVGQVFMVGGAAGGVSQATVDAVQGRHVGSIILTGRTTRGVAPTAALTTRLQALVTPASTAGVGLLMATDQEGGQVQVLRGPGFSDMPSALVQGRSSPQDLRGQARDWGGQLRSAGVDVDLAPVLDTVPGPDAAAGNPPIGAYDREYGYTPGDVADHGTAFAQGMADAGVATAGKHFPGLGRVGGNTDTTAGVTDTVTTRGDTYLQPFATAVRSGMPMLMMSSAYYSRIDAAQPAAFSSTVVDGMVRQDLGFTGVVVSDDLGNAQQVAAWSPGDRAVQFLAAGGDLVLTVNAAQLPAMVDGVLARARADDGFRARVQQAALRVLRLKQEHGLVPAVPGDGSPHALTGGEPMTGGQQVTSPDGRYALTLQSDGNVVSYAPGSRALWDSGTWQHPGAVLVMQTDGNAVLYASDGAVLWSSGTWGNLGATLRVQDDGNVVVYRADGVALWSTGWDRTGLRPGDELVPGQRVTSPNGLFWLLLARDGDVEVWTRDGRRIFYSGTTGTARLALQSDGNLVAYRADGRALWDSGTWTAGPSRLQVQDDGNVVLYRADGSASWSTGWDGGGVATSPN
jgi:beta-N-acetylhexosaminidase